MTCHIFPTYFFFFRNSFQQPKLLDFETLPCCTLTDDSTIIIENKY